MAGYLSSRKLGNVMGRMKYITDENKQENIVDYHNTTDNEFWKVLAKESRERHKEVKARGKCCEARELIIGIPQNLEISAEELCSRFKSKYGVECTCAIHRNDKDGIINKHCHLIFSERKKLNIPEIREEKRATRTYYYDEKGHKCKKSEAVKVVKKGTILQKGTIRYFTEKDEYFKSQKFVYECKEIFLKELLKIDWSLESDLQNKELSEKHIGKNNIKGEYIKKNNKLKAIVKNVCKAGDFITEQKEGTMYKDLKKGYGIQSFVAPNYEDNEMKVYSFVSEMQSLYKTRVKNEVKKHNKINQDVGLLQREDYVFEPIQRQIIFDYEPQTHSRNKPKVIEFLKEKLVKMVERIERLVHIQDLLYIEPKKKIEVYQDKRNNDLYIENHNNIRKEQGKEKDDYDLEM